MSKNPLHNTPKQLNTFSAAYQTLNTDQKKAVDMIEGPVLVIAGPGTGKTQVLALRVANILLKTDAKAEDILLITFTESGTKAMRNRLLQIIGTDAYRVQIHTFHSFAGLLINEYPEDFPHIVGSTVATDLERVNIIEEALETTTIKLLRPVGDPRYYVKPILRQIEELKQENITPSELTNIVSEQERNLLEIEQFHLKGPHKGKERGEYTKQKRIIDKNIELQSVYQYYQNRLEQLHRYDFADMIIAALSALEHNQELLRDVQERFLYLLADEHQDVSGAQNQLLECLASYGERPNVFVVGDEKQAIYRFQGASLENFLYFEDRFKDTTVISLTDNYRSTQPILDAAHELIKVETGPLVELRQPLSSQTEEAGGIAPQFVSFDHQGQEDQWLVETIKEKLKAGIPASEIAVIVRTNREVEALTTHCRKLGLAVAPSAETDILNHPIIKTIEQLLLTVAEPDNEVALGKTLLSVPLSFGDGDLGTLFASRSRFMRLSTLISKPADTVKGELTSETLDSLTTFSQTLTSARKRTTLELPHDTVAYLLRETGYLDYIEINQPLEGPRIIRRLYDEIEVLERSGEVTDITSLVKAFRLRRDYNLPLNAPFLGSDAESVSITTAHKAKGLEFACVFIPHAVDSTWGTKQSRSNFSIPLTKLVDQANIDSADDEKRLFYVAMTRAKSELYISAAEHNDEGADLVPSRFVTTLLPEYLEEVPGDVSAADPLAVVIPLPSALIDHQQVLSLFKERGFSATSLNNYLDNPWHYFFRNLLRVPEVLTLSLRFGTIMHHTLEWTTRHKENGVLPPLSDVEEEFIKELSRHPLTTKEVADLTLKAKHCLPPYHNHLSHTLSASTREEFSVSVLLPTGLPELPEITLTGTLDRLDFDESGALVRVLDYKTGKPRSRNQIEGKTKEANRGYRRQLEFYALLLSLYDNQQYHTEQFTISFVEPNQAGVIKEETFVISKSDIETVKSEIVSAAKRLINGEFLHDKEAAENSDYADLAQRFLL